MQLMQTSTWSSLPRILAAAAIAGALTTGGCAGVKPGATTGTGGSTGFGGGIGTLPPINGLESLSVSPTSASVTLTASAAGMLTPATFQFSATGSVRGVPTDVTQMVTWQVDLKGVMS